jgi:acyl-CoA reductase-like NAD-dependent aldehyde dehydrogenase
MQSEIQSMIIQGRPLMSGKSSDVVNPSTGKSFAQCYRATEREIDMAVDAASNAFKSWAKTSWDERAEMLKAMAAKIEENVSELALLLSQEGGCPIMFTEWEVGGLAQGMRYFAELSGEPKLLEESEERRARLFRRPLGPVAAITPWNFPIDVLSVKLSPALMAGNTLVIKPAGTTPLTTLKIVELAQEIFPSGVINAVADENDMGGYLTSHPSIRKVTFTGSTAVGSKVMAAASEDLKRVTLELGGNDSAIICEDADIGSIAEQIHMGMFLHNGQSCVGIKRVYVHDSRHDELVDALRLLAEGAKVGGAEDPDTWHGPIHSPVQLERAREFLADGLASGKVATGGKEIDRPGYFMEQTIIIDIADDAKLVREEQFSPVVPIMRFKDDAEAITRANASEYGLGSSVWSADKDRAFAIANQLETGMVWVNKYADIAHHLPFIGAKHSGLGVELGEEGLHEFTQPQTISEAP